LFEWTGALAFAGSVDRLPGMMDINIVCDDSAIRVAVGPGLLGDVGELLRRHGDMTDVCVVTDEHVGSLYAEKALSSLRLAGLSPWLHTIAPGEDSKCLSEADALFGALATAGFGRDGIILALGGGVVSDLAGFVAATWCRGVRWAVCPTTLEADLDAAIGGKTAVNTSAGKNLVGAFHQPVLIAIDSTCPKTLDSRDVRAGLAESVKHGLIASEELLSWQASRTEAILSLDEETVGELIIRNVHIKADFVSRDPFERSGVRIMLNFGHTIGHAIESACCFRLRHGECVALGTLAACRLSHMCGLLDESVVDRLSGILSDIGLPTALHEPISTDGILRHISQDKKKRGKQVRYVLLTAVGEPVVRSDVPEDLVRAAYESLLV